MGAPFAPEIDEPGNRSTASLAHIFWVFFYIGATSFGGGVVAYLREHLVERQQWLDADHFLAALEIAETVPGLISTNVSVIVGSRLRGVMGSIVAVLGMTVPGAVVVFALGILYAHFRKNPDVGAVLAGVAAAAVGLILAVTIQIGYRGLRKRLDLAILIPTFILVGVYHISLIPVLVVLAPIAVQLNRPNGDELAAYHAQQSAYHAQLAEHHDAVAARHAAKPPSGS
ncbi:MAG TPA: chromate transporter [Candidatus Binataceae bacterium]|nr:chromate transporter [Candidatus Binataceae bacterium]